MIFSSLKPSSLAAKLAGLALLSVFGFSGCGGGGSADSVSREPAPQTFNGLVLNLYTGGVNLTFIRAEGDAMTGTETGAVTMAENPVGFGGVDPSGASIQHHVSTSISGARYTYQRTSAEAGVLTVTGAGSGTSIDVNKLGVPYRADYFKEGSFARTYNLLFGTDGSVISGLSVNDSGEGLLYPGILWISPTLKVYGGSSIPVGWSLAMSQGLALPTIYPLKVSGQRFEVTPDNPLVAASGFQFLTSTFTRFSDAVNDFKEEGVGNMDAVPSQLVINYDYQPNPKTNNHAKIRIYQAGSTTPAIYDVTFLDFEKGTYVREDGSTGTFEFPFVNN
ncbi:MAG: hypothetical protein ORN51_10780 [Akkermansiaceae bacterium]|nr:hypothetical protein [Akkermansiaceae bacterium]